MPSPPARSKARRRLLRHSALARWRGGAGGAAGGRLRPVRPPAKTHRFPLSTFRHSSSTRPSGFRSARNASAPARPIERHQAKARAIRGPRNRQVAGVGCPATTIDPFRPCARTAARPLQLTNTRTTLSRAATSAGFKVLSTKSAGVLATQLYVATRRSCPGSPAGCGWTRRAGGSTVAGRDRL